MTLEFDAAGDFVDVTDGLQSVTVTRPGSASSTAVSHALRSAARSREASRSDGHYSTSDAVWQLPISELPDSPRLGDVIVDGDNQRWTVLNVTRATPTGRWRCLARNLAIAHGLDAYVDIEKATYVKGDGGAEKATWQTWKTGVPARIQPEKMEVIGEHDRRLSAIHFTIFVTQDVALDHTHRIKGPDGSVYRVTGSRKADRLDALMEIEVVKLSVEE